MYIYIYTHIYIYIYYVYIYIFVYSLHTHTCVYIYIYTYIHIYIYIYTGGRTRAFVFKRRCGSFYLVYDHGKHRNAKRYNFGCNLLGGETKVTPKVVPFSEKKPHCEMSLHEQSRNPHVLISTVVCLNGSISTRWWASFKKPCFG